MDRNMLTDAQWAFLEVVGDLTDRHRGRHQAIEGDRGGGQHGVAGHGGDAAFEVAELVVGVARGRERPGHHADGGGEGPGGLRAQAGGGRARRGPGSGRAGRTGPG